MKKIFSLRLLLSVAAATSVTAVHASSTSIPDQAQVVDPTAAQAVQADQPAASASSVQEPAAPTSTPVSAPQTTTLPTVADASAAAAIVVEATTAATSGSTTTTTTVETTVDASGASTTTITIAPDAGATVSSDANVTRAGTSSAPVSTVESAATNQAAAPASDTQVVASQGMMAHLSDYKWYYLGGTAVAVVGGYFLYKWVQEQQAKRKAAKERVNQRLRALRQA